MRSFRLFLSLAAALSLFAQQPPPDMPLTPAVRDAVIEASAEKIEQLYVFEEQGKKIAAAVRAAQKNGTFKDIGSALKLVPAMNRVLSATVRDKHLAFGYTDVPKTTPVDAPETAAEREERIRYARRFAYGIDGVRRLDGNVGLLTWMSFEGPDTGAGDALAAAMTLLASSDALIIDMRDSDGGSPAMVQLLMTYFLPEGDPLHLVSIYYRSGNVTRQVWSLPYVPAPRYVGKDVYVLTSDRTWSAAEGFTEHMKRLTKAVIVGETTSGGAHIAQWVNMHPNLAVKMPIARVFDPVSGTNWEGKGVEPQIAVDEKDALKTAHLRALQALRDKAPDDELRSFLSRAIGRVEGQ